MICIFYSIDTVARIESWMDPLEIYACIFLLYENVDTALQDICFEIQTCRRYLPVLDSVLFKLVLFCNFDVYYLTVIKKIETKVSEVYLCFVKI